MKVLFSIGHTTWLASSAVEAAKVADAISKFQPLQRDWNNHSFGADVFFHDNSNEHAVTLVELLPRHKIVDSEKAAAALRKECKT